MASQKKKLSCDEIHALRGKYKIPDDKPFAEEWAEYKRKEKELEERKYQRPATGTPDSSQIAMSSSQVVESEGSVPNWSQFATLNRFTACQTS